MGKFSLNYEIYLLIYRKRVNSRHIITTALPATVPRTVYIQTIACSTFCIYRQCYIHVCKHVMGYSIFKLLFPKRLLLNPAMNLWEDIVKMNCSCEYTRLFVVMLNIYLFLLKNARMLHCWSSMIWLQNQLNYTIMHFYLCNKKF